MRSILIAGSEGFIGHHLVNRFTKAGYEVFGCDLFETALHGDYSYYKVTRLSPEWEEIFGNHPFDFCINASGSGNVPYSMTHPVADFEANALDTIRILDAIRRLNKNCRYLHISSAAVYGNPKSLPVREDAVLQPLSPYGYHKLIAEELCREYYKVFGIHTAIVRPFSVYGDGLRKQLLWDVCSKLKKSSQVQLFGTGKESRDFLHVSDLASLLQLLVERSPFESEVYNAASGVESSLCTVAALFEKCFGTEKKITFSGESRAGDPINWKADISRISNLGFKPEITIEDGVPAYVRWFQSI